MMGDVLMMGYVLIKFTTKIFRWSRILEYRQPLSWVNQIEDYIIK